jgi:hypothetical protein
MPGGDTWTPYLIDRLPGSPEAKERLKWVLQVHGGARTVSEACAALHMSPEEFEELRETALAGMLAALADVGRDRPDTL